MARSTPDPSQPQPERPATLGELRASGWRPRTVKQELRANLLARLAAGDVVFPGIVGYDETVIPAIENAILAGQDIVFLGERGQAKTRLARLLVELLDEWLPVVRGGELNDDPFAPISPAAKAMVAEHGDDTPIDWLPRDRRYAEKLATPGHHHRRPHRRGGPDQGRRGPLPRRRADPPLRADPARQPRHLRASTSCPTSPSASRLACSTCSRSATSRSAASRSACRWTCSWSPRPTPRTTRPAVGSSRRSRTASAPRSGPTTRARSTTRSTSSARRSTASTRRGMPPVVAPRFMEELVAELTHLARRSPEISQRSGVSVRVSVANTEVLEAAALKRAVRLGEPSPRRASATSAPSWRRRPARSSSRRSATRRPRSGSWSGWSPRPCTRRSAGGSSVDDLEPVIEAFEDGLVETGDGSRRASTSAGCARCPGLHEAVRRLGAFDVTDGAEEPGARRVGGRVPPRGPAPPRRLNKDRGRPGRRLPPLTVASSPWPS